MGLLDNVLGGALGRVAGGQAGAPAGGKLLQLVMALVQQHGGLAGLLDTLGQHGLSEQVASWVGKGANLPVTGERSFRHWAAGRWPNWPDVLVSMQPTSAGNWRLFCPKRSIR